MRNTNGRRGRHGLMSWVATIALTGTLAGGILSASPRFHSTTTSTTASASAATAATTPTTTAATPLTPISVTFRGDDESQAFGDN
jgi:hypothetical protein